MKKILALMLAVLMVMACFVGCNGNDKNKLTIATSPDFPPFEYYDDNNNVIGIEIEILKLVCEELGYTLDIQTMNFDAVLTGVASNKYQLGVSGISVTPERQENMLFTNPYCLAAQAIVVKEGSAITSKTDLTGKKVSVQLGTTAQDYCSSNGYDVSSFEANADAQTALVTGKVDAWVIDDLTAAEMVTAYNAENPDAKLKVLDDAMTTEPYAFALALGNEELAEKINTVLDKLVAEGKVAQIFEQYNAPYTSPSEK
ncbi:MAG: transporter substrate-binding domain-containing protein [Clostridiales bacterium]|nr:transporter substrate-binding domain-containing protein [Clostridiales bacterium]